MTDPLKLHVEELNKEITPACGVHHCNGTSYREHCRNKEDGKYCRESSEYVVIGPLGDLHVCARHLAKIRMHGRYGNQEAEK